MSKISPRLREEAAVYCSAMACWWMDPAEPDDSSCPWPPSRDVEMLTMDLIEEIEGSSFTPWTEDEQATLYAEAEALLRTGWEP